MPLVVPGMVMVDVLLLDEDKETLGRGSRPFILTQSSWLVRQLRTMLFAVPLALGVTWEEQHHELR